MSAVGRAIWFIESHFESDISLEEISEAAGLSRYHLSRIFGLVTGHSISGYIRGRRLSRAVPALLGSSSTILEVALCAGYGSHEAFTRAFRDQFGMTPDAVRRQGHARNLVLLEPIRMDPAHLNDLEPPRFETLQPMLFAGLQEIYPYGGNAAIPSLAEIQCPFRTYLRSERQCRLRHLYAYRRRSGEIPLYGRGRDLRCRRSAGGFCNAQASRPALRRLCPSRPRLRHSGDDEQDFGAWWPTSGLEHGETPDMFERYDERFDPYTGMGVTEIWLPIRA